MENKNLLKKTAIKILILFILTGMSFVSCKTKDGNSFEKEKELLAEYIANNNITAIPTSSGLYYIELVEGIGEQAKSGDKVNVQYTGKRLDGTIFDSGPYSFVLGTGAVIAGWHEGFAMMKKGGKATLIIPSNLAYGSSGYLSIDPYTTLIFDVELLNIQ